MRMGIITERLSVHRKIGINFRREYSSLYYMGNRAYVLNT